jgi:hypothetical protein
MQLSGLTGWLVLNIATRILIRTYKFWAANKTSAFTHFRLSKPLKPATVLDCCEECEVSITTRTAMGWYVVSTGQYSRTFRRIVSFLLVCLTQKTKAPRSCDRVALSCVFLHKHRCENIACRPACYHEMPPGLLAGRIRRFGMYAAWICSWLSIRFGPIFNW